MALQAHPRDRQQQQPQQPPQDRRLFHLNKIIDTNEDENEDRQLVGAAFNECGRRKILCVLSESSVHLAVWQGQGRGRGRAEPETWAVSVGGRALGGGGVCVEPAGWWAVVATEDGLIAVPTSRESRVPLPCAKWTLTGVSALPTADVAVASTSALCWWQTDDSRHFIIIGDRQGDVSFYSLDSYSVVAKTCIVGGIRDLEIYTDDSLDEITLLITSVKKRQWRLILEKRSIRYDWLSGKKERGKIKEFNKKIDDFFTSVKEYGGDKMSNLFQIKSQSSTDVRSKLTASSSTNAVSNVPLVERSNPSPITFKHLEDVTIPKSSESDANAGVNGSRWLVSPQIANGRHFVSIYNPSRGVLGLQNSLDDDKFFLVHSVENPSADLHLVICKQNVFYVISSKCISLRSSHLASQKDSSYTSIWEDELDESEDVIAAFGVDEISEFPPYLRNWNDTKEVSQLDLPRFKIDSCLIVTNKNVYQLTTRCDPCEWLVNELVIGNKGIERFAAALSVDLQPLLVGAADILLARRHISKSLTLYRLAKVSLDESLIRMGALGFFNDIVSGVFPQNNSASDICFIAYTLQSLVLNDDRIIINFIHNNSYFSISECLQLCVELGLWDAAMTICYLKGVFNEVFVALMSRLKSPCRGLLTTFLQKPFVHFVITDRALPLLKYIEHYCESFDTYLLKELCIWMCPLQDSFHIILHALTTSQPNGHLGGMRRLIRTFFGVLSTLHTRLVSKPYTKLSEVNNEQLPVSVEKETPETDSVIVPSDNSTKSYLSCGLTHWGLTNKRLLCLTNDKVPEFINIDREILGNILNVACGRSHTIILSENGVYSLGENGFGQLGVGKEYLYTSVYPVLVSLVGNYISSETSSPVSPFWGNEIITQVAAGQYHSACVTDKGVLYTWGWAVHGQLGHGLITNEYFPRKVKFFENEKVKFVGCGSCHTGILTESGNVYLCGNGAFGQIGNSERQKCNIPMKIELNNFIVEIAVGYYHTLARTVDNIIWIWGSSPQSLRVGSKANNNSTQNENSHLQPNQVNLSNVKGHIIKMTAGWHHSCLLDSNGNIYVWGLNLDGQLGSGDEKEVPVPTIIDKWGPNNEIPAPTIIDIGCGGDFTLLFTSEYKLMISGNSNQLFQDVNTKSARRIVTLKSTRRILRLPNPHPPAQRYFRYVPLPTSFSNIYTEHLDCKWNQRFPNPIKQLSDFDSPDWATNTLTNLHQFVDDDTPLVDIWLRAKLANLRKDFAEELNLQLNSLFIEKQPSNCDIYLQHTNGKDSNTKFEVIKTMIENLKNLSRNIIDKNNKYVDSTSDLYCQCVEDSFLVDETPQNPSKAEDLDIEKTASSILISTFSNLPHDSSIWSDCVGQATLFWIQHELNMSVLEKVLCDVLRNGNAADMASAIFCSNNNIDYQKILSTGFNIDLCENILQFL